MMPKARYSDRQRRSHLSRFGIDKLEQLKKQNGRCAICGTDSAVLWTLDHSEETRKARGVLCNSCNIGLAFLESEGWLEKALAYLASGGVIIDSKVWERYEQGKWPRRSHA